MTNQMVLPTKFSYSNISTYKTCKFRWKLQYLDKNYVYSDSVATKIGSLIHETEEAIANALLNKQAINYIALKNHVIVESHRIAHQFPNDYFKPDKAGKTYDEKLLYYLTTSIYHLENYLLEHPELEIIGIEEKFNFNYNENHSFTGSIDRAFLNRLTAELIIQDIKTWPVAASDSELKAPLQFAIYSMAASEIWKIDASNIRCEYYLPFCDLSQQATSADLITEASKEIDKIFKGIQELDFKPSASPLCYWCSYSITNPNRPKDSTTLCPYHSLWTPDEKNTQTASQWLGLDLHDSVLKQYLEAVQKLKE